MNATPISPDDAFAGAAQRGNELRPTLSYFGQPVLKRPHWNWNVVAYLFLGGLMGGSGLLAALADESAEPGHRLLARNAKYASFILSALCPVILIGHLGRPERFHYMLRIVKIKSPMSLGVWGLTAFSGLAGMNAAASLFGIRTRIFNAPQAAMGLFIAGYTGVLISATAIPIWAKGKYHIPAMSVCSGLAGACALHAALLPAGALSARKRLERLETVAAVAEAVLVFDFRRYGGDYAKPMFEGKIGAKLRNVTLIGGIAIPVAIALVSGVRGGHVSRTLSFASGVLALAGGYVLRESLIESGKRSADDPAAGLRQPE
ncbi:MAG: polysulfide reductase NrfD [Candidatus Eremiobacteraeota bacterium]|nr:polysulfide reductase NrfD [Candidatus Eremiobacteraeota bacterium]